MMPEKGRKKRKSKTEKTEMGNKDSWPAAEIMCLWIIQLFCKAYKAYDATAIVSFPDGPQIPMGKEEDTPVG